MKLLQILYFLTLVESGSFKKASETLNVSQPAVSMQIASLEKEWEIMLFDRMYKKTTLTPSGKIMYDMLSGASSDYESALTKAKALYQETKTKINIGIPEYFGLMGFDDIILGFRQKHSEISIHLEVCPASEMSLEKRESGQFDIIINQSYLISNSPNICKEVIRSNYATLNIPEKECYADMEAKDVLSLFNGQKLYIPFVTKVVPFDSIREICNSVGFEPGEIIAYPSIHSVMIAAKMGFGVALLDEGMFIPQELHLQSFRTNNKLDWALAWRRDNEKECLEELLSDMRKLCEGEKVSGDN